MTFARSGVKYLICPGEVISQTDGDIHFVSANQLMRLYKVRPDQCIVLPDVSPEPPRNNYRQLLLRRAKRGELKALRPSYTGNYKLEENDQ